MGLRKLVFHLVFQHHNKLESLGVARIALIGVLLAALGWPGTAARAAEPGLPFTEDFADAGLKDAGGTTANWSVEERAVYLQWRDHVRSGQVGWTQSGGVIGEEFGHASEVDVGDVDGDGDLDLVTIQSSPFGDVIAGGLLFLNDGEGAPFDTAGEGMPIGTRADGTIRSNAIALGDMDGDGDLDVVMGNMFYEIDEEFRETLGGAGNRLYLNDGDGEPFDTAGEGLPVGTDEALTGCIALGDIDGNGTLDVVAGDTIAVESGDVNKIYLNDGEGDPFDTVGAGTPIGSHAGSTRQIALGDINGDGALDIVVSEQRGGRLYLSRGESPPFDMTTTGTELVPVTEYTYDVAIGDVDGNGDLDVIFGSIESALLFLNDGEGQPFDSGGTGMPVGGEYMRSVALGDADGDGDLDLFTLIGGPIDEKLRIILNDGEGAPFDTDGEGRLIESDPAAYLGRLADFDGDGALDIVARMNVGVAVLLNQREVSSFAAAEPSFAIGTDADETEVLALGDINGDGHLDVVAGNDGSRAKYYLNDGLGLPFDTIEEGRSIFLIGSDVVAIALGDLNGDGRLDAVLKERGENLYIRMNSGSEDPWDDLRATMGDDTFNMRAIALGDMDGDGDLDMVTGDDSDPCRLYLNEGG